MKSAMDGADEQMESLYGDESPKSKGTPETVDQENAEEMEHQAVIPLKVLMGKHTEPLKENDEVVVKIDKINGDQATISYSETKPGEIGKEDDGENPPTELSADDELEQLGKVSSY